MLAAVRATDHFLQEADIVALRPVVKKQALQEVPQLAVLWRDGMLAGFVGADGDNIEMLFVHPSQRGGGLGRALLQYALEQWHCTKVDVNEQNEAGAAGFYRHMGFSVVSRSALDGGGGNPFPILRLSL